MTKLLENLKFKEFYCSLNGNTPQKIKTPYINLYVQLDGCNADCSFCEYKNNGNVFNTMKFRETLIQLKEEIKINKISITGGEPTLNLILLYDIISIIKDISPDSFLVMNTNGYNLKEFKESVYFKFIDSIALSRHHYKDKVNNEIFKFKTLSTNELKELLKGNESKFHFSCNLMKSYISSKGEIHKYLEFCNSVGCLDVGFVSLMEINSFAENEKIDIDLNEIISERLIKTKSWKNNDNCKCNNYLYITKSKEIVKIYKRQFMKETDYTDILVFNGGNLLDGFNGKILK